MAKGIVIDVRTGAMKEVEVKVPTDISELPSPHEAKDRMKKLEERIGRLEYELKVLKRVLEGVLRYFDRGEVRTRGDEDLDDYKNWASIRKKVW